MTLGSTKSARFRSFLTTGIAAFVSLLLAQPGLASSPDTNPVATPAAEAAGASEVMLTVDDGSMPSTVATLAAVPVPVVPICNFSVSTRPLDFGVVEIGATATEIRVLTNEGDATCEIMVQIIDNSGLGQYSLVSSPAFTLDPGSGAEVAVKFAPLAKGTDRRDELRLASGDPNNPQQVDIPLWGVGIPAAPSESCSFVVTDPDTPLDFGDVDTGASVTLGKTVTNNGSVACEITATMASATGQFTLATSSPLSIAPGTSADVAVTFAPVAEGVDQGVLNLTSEDANQPLSVDIALAGNGVTPSVEACDFSVDPPTLAFGGLTIGDSSALSTTVINNGTDACSLSASVSGSGEFTLATPAPVSVAAGGTATVSVSYAPIDVGTDSGKLTLTDAVTKQTVAVGLFGSGVDAPAAVCEGIKVKAIWKSLHRPNAYGRRHHHGAKYDDADDHDYGLRHHQKRGRGGSTYGQLFVIGRGERDGKFILSNAEDPEQIIAQRSGRTGSFLFRIDERRLNPMPCRVRVDQPDLGLCGAAAVIDAPADCGIAQPDDHDQDDDAHEADED